MTRVRFVLFPLMLATLISCTNQPDLDALRQEIVAMHRSFIQAHLDKDAAFLAKPTSPKYVAVANGEVQSVTPEEMEQRMSAYLNATKFTHYKDVADPIVEFSDDGSVAWAIVQVRVAGDRTMSDGSSRSFDTRWAWITVYRKIDNQWQRMVDVSTNRPWEDASGPPSSE